MKKYLEAAKVYLKVKLMWRVDLIFGFISIVMKIIFASLLNSLTICFLVSLSSVS